MARGKIQNIKKQNLTDQVYNTLKDLILSGEWPAGYRVPTESELAEQFGVSRLTVHSAFQKLAALSLIDVRVGEGTFVKDFSLASYISEIGSIVLRESTADEIVQFRASFEIAALKLAIKNAASEDYAVLYSFLRKMEEYSIADNLDSYVDVDIRFHRAVCELSHNHIFVTLYDICSSLLRENYLRTNSHRSYEKTQTADADLHRKIVDAMMEKNVEKAVEYYTMVIQDTYDYSVIDR